MSAAPSIDLHTHSTCSDGALSPAELVRQAAAAGIAMLALTDHDSVDGVAVAAEAAAAAGLQLVPGVEISALWHSQTVHVLGLWVDPQAAPLRVLLSAQAERRDVRMREICLRLERLRLPGAQLLAAVQAQPGLPTRSHLAQALVAGGHVRGVEDAFRKYLGAGKRAHVAATWPDLGQVVAAIHAAGGAASLAHPARYRLSRSARRRLLTAFAAAGGDALEVVSGGNGVQHAEASASWALEFGLAGSVGSDFHGPHQAWNPLGRYLKLPAGVRPLWQGRCGPSGAAN